jgi:hypothetical protein
MMTCHSDALFFFSRSSSFQFLFESFTLVLHLPPTRGPSFLGGLFQLQYSISLCAWLSHMITSNYSSVDAIMEPAAFFSLLAVFWCLLAVVLLHQLLAARNESKCKPAEKCQPLDDDIGKRWCIMMHFSRALPNSPPLERYLGRLLEMDAPSLNIPLLPIEAALRSVNEYAEAPIATGFPKVDAALQQARAMHVGVQTTRHSAAQLAYLDEQGGPVASDEFLKQMAKAVVDRHHEETKEAIIFLQPFLREKLEKALCGQELPEEVRLQVRRELGLD